MSFNLSAIAVGEVKCYTVTSSKKKSERPSTEAARGLAAQAAAGLKEAVAEPIVS
jgi:hypothetical protein